MKDLPIYDISLEDDSWGIYAVSLVENPAIEQDFIYMSAEDEENRFVFSDEDKREVVGPILIPDILIYRKVNDQEFYVRFTKETIIEINARMQQTDGNKMFTVEHELGANGTVQFLESWIKETDEDKSSALGIDAPLGSLFIKAKIESDLLWDMVKAERLKGFSVELDASIIKAQLTKILNEKEPEMIDYKSMYSNSLTVNDTEILFNGELSQGSVILTLNEDEATPVVPYEGSFTVDNIEYQVTGGLVTDVKDIQLSIEEKMDSVLRAFEELRTELTPEPKEGEGEEDLNEKLDAILSKIEEERLERLQAETERLGFNNEEVEEAVEFSVDNYRSVGEWFKKMSN